MILFVNLTLAIIARQEVEKVIQKIGARHYKYCIQANRKAIDSWLDLTPLTAWNKSMKNRRAKAFRHSVLVIEKDSTHILYHWSYRQRKWKLTSVGFEPDVFIIPSSLECNPESNYSTKLPLFLDKNFSIF